MSGRFQMQSFHDGTWKPMEDGPGRAVWKPRATAADAVLKCLTWTGLLCIPAMRVVDLTTGSVVWQDRYHAGLIPDDEDAALDRIVPAWAEPVYAAARAEMRGERPQDAALFDLLDIEEGDAA